MLQGFIPYHVGRAIAFLTSTPRDEEVGNVTQVQSAQHLAHHLLGKKALVIGGTRGIGRGIALELTRGGCAGITVVGRDTSKIVSEMERVASSGSILSGSSGKDGRGQVLTAYSADLYTVDGAAKMVDTLAAAVRSAKDGAIGPFDYVFFTVGCWPNYNDPFTADGIEKTVALDLVARHVVLKLLIEHKLLNRNEVRVMSTLASAQKFPFQSVQRVQKCLEDAAKSVPPGYVPFSLMPVGIAGDAWLREASEKYKSNNIRFVGMFPGLVFTDVATTSFPKWMAPFLRAKLWLISHTEEEAGLSHITVITSENVGRKQVSFFNHLLEARLAHHVALDNEMSKFVFNWLERTYESFVKK